MIRGHKRYLGIRDASGPRVRVMVARAFDSVTMTNTQSRAYTLDARPSQAVWNHSPDGFEWGYGGSGPAQLALALLLDMGTPRAQAVRLHQPFKWAFVASLPRDGWELDVADLLAWVKAQPELQELAELGGEDQP